MALISVVIPCYNAAPWLRETIASVLAQSLPPLEVIVVDDGSTDGSGEIVAAEFPPARLLTLPNGGPSAARNAGAGMARGEWIQFLDADDLLHPAKLAHQAAALPDLADDVAFVYSSWQTMTEHDGNWRAAGEPRSTSQHADLAAQVFDEFIHLSSGLMRKSWFNRVGGFDHAKPLIEDVHLQVRLLLAGATFAYVNAPTPLFTYRQLPASLSRREPDRFVAECYANLRLAEEEFGERGTLSPSLCEALARGYHFVARHYAGRDWQRFNEVVVRIERLVPGFVPDAPASLAVTSRLIGYRRAEHVAVAFRGLKSRFGVAR